MLYTPWLLMERQQQERVTINFSVVDNRATAARTSNYKFLMVQTVVCGYHIHQALWEQHGYDLHDTSTAVLSALTRRKRTTAAALLVCSRCLSPRGNWSLQSTYQCVDLRDCLWYTSSHHTAMPSNNISLVQLRG